MTTEKPLVRFENVQKSYDGEILVVKDFNLDVAKGEFAVSYTHLTLPTICSV